jgi:hypothetical protein
MANLSDHAMAVFATVIGCGLVVLHLIRWRNERAQKRRDARRA